jgi:hypothetical protein
VAQELKVARVSLAWRKRDEPGCQVLFHPRRQSRDRMMGMKRVLSNLVGGELPGTKTYTGHKGSIR